jgi:hypothetical protein
MRADHQFPPENETAFFFTARRLTLPRLCSLAIRPPNFVTDHKIPLEPGGSNEKSNLQAQPSDAAKGWKH